MMTRARKWKSRASSSFFMDKAPSVNPELKSIAVYEAQCRFKEKKIPLE